MEELEKELTSLSSKDPDVPVLVRGDERLNYGSIMSVVKTIYKSNVRKMALVTVEK
jgi:biopolymer transport protein ExbD